MACLSNEELAAACDGALSRGVADKIREHLSICPRCAQELTQLSGILAELPQGKPPSEELLRRAKRLGQAIPSKESSAHRLTKQTIQKNS